MGYPTPIEWCDATWNPVGGCEILSPGCTNCYAMRIAASPRLIRHALYAGVTRMVKGFPVFNGILTALVEGHNGWTWPLRWRGATNPEHPPKLGPGQPSLIFVGDMADLFHKKRWREHIDRVVATAIASRHICQLLTKRADVMAAYFTDLGLPARLKPLVAAMRPKWPESQVLFEIDRAKDKIWLGFSAERQEEFDLRWRSMKPLSQAGWQVFVSCEPLLGRICLPLDFLRNMPRKPWVITGGESGPNARPAHPDWFRLLRDQCVEYGLPFFFKQWGEWWEVASEARDEEDEHIVVDVDTLHAAEAFDVKTDCLIDTHGTVYRNIAMLPPNVKARHLTRLGKRAAGRDLDGQQHNELPRAA